MRWFTFSWEFYMISIGVLALDARKLLREKYVLFWIYEVKIWSAHMINFLLVGFLRYENFLEEEKTRSCLMRGAGEFHSTISIGRCGKCGNETTREKKTNLFSCHRRIGENFLLSSRVLPLIASRST